MEEEQEEEAFLNPTFSVLRKYFKLNTAVHFQLTFCLFSVDPIVVCGCEGGVEVVPVSVVTKRTG